MPLCLGITPCPNDIYIFGGLLRGAVDTGDVAIRWHLEDVETLNGMALGGNLDAAKISAAALAHLGDAYRVLACGGAVGRGCGPLLLDSALGDAGPSDAPVMVPGRHTTAGVLLDFYLGGMVEKEYLPYDRLYARLCREEGLRGVVIHEARFTYRRDGLRLLADLGAHWEGRTGLPVPLGVIVAKRQGDLPGRMEKWIRASLAWAGANRAEALEQCRRHARELEVGVIAAHVDLYVNEFTHEMGQEGRRALDKLLVEARERAPGSGRD